MFFDVFAIDSANNKFYKIMTKKSINVYNKAFKN